MVATWECPHHPVQEPHNSSWELLCMHTVPLQLPAKSDQKPFVNLTGSSDEPLIRRMIIWRIQTFNHLLDQWVNHLAWTVSRLTWALTWVFRTQSLPLVASNGISYEKRVVILFSSSKGRFQLVSKISQDKKESQTLNLDIMVFIWIKLTGWVKLINGRVSLNALWFRVQYQWRVWSYYWGFYFLVNILCRIIIKNKALKQTNRLILFSYKGFQYTNKELIKINRPTILPHLTWCLFVRKLKTRTLTPRFKIRNVWMPTCFRQVYTVKNLLDYFVVFHTISCSA